ncbi:MAG: hypothetical protein H6742_05870 [Alphaproteobacteria bacterium]|nr:hypothetical protein [Alphaproteobacteria bacterium]
MSRSSGRPPARPRARTRLNPGRLAAGRSLLAVERGGHVEDLLAETAPSEGADRGLAWHLALGVLRQQRRLDTALAAHCGRPLVKVDAGARIALRIGLFEAAASRTPDHAAVDQAVELCRRLGAPRATGFVNAVLRKAAAVPLDDDPQLGLPPWLVERFADGWEAWRARLDEAPPLCGVWRDAAQVVEGVAAGPARAAGSDVPGAFVVADAQGAVEDLPGFREGRWWVMDPAAAAVADLAGAGEGTRVLDACAAPGGKSLRLAASGAQVTAVDLVPARLARVDEASARTGLAVQTRVHDWLDGPSDDLGLFDVVLVDAPCTGLGTLRRHPEIRWRREPTDPAAMALRQRRILAAAARHVTQGGRLVYAVCSPMPEEGPQVAEALSGWQVVQRWSSAPPQDDEDAFQAFVLERSPVA